MEPAAWINVLSPPGLRNGDAGSLAVECSGYLLIFDVSPSSLAVGDQLRELVATTPWPKPGLG